MITAFEIKQKATRKYIDFLRRIVIGMEFQPLVIVCNKKANPSMAEFDKELSNIRSLSKEVKGFGYTIEWKKVNTKNLGAQDLPNTILFESEDDFVRFLQKTREVAQFKDDVKLIAEKYSILLQWIEKYPQKVIDNAGLWPDLLKVLDYFSENPNPHLYIRELPIEVHTKFIESNTSVIRDMLDIVIADKVLPDEKEFEKRFGLRYDEPILRMRLLDSSKKMSLFSGVDDISLPISQFCKLSLPFTKVFVVENKVNFLTFPSTEESIVIWGHGYGIATLKNSNWLKHADIYYWGDMDAQGFEILSQFRGYYPQTKSIMMDQSTFDKFFENDMGTPSNVTTELNLTIQEKSLYYYVKENNYRLEQEKIPQKYVIEQLKNLK